jgi:hypothetical protein
MLCDDVIDQKTPRLVEGAFWSAVRFFRASLHAPAIAGILGCRDEGK